MLLNAKIPQIYVTLTELDESRWFVINFALELQAMMEKNSQLDPKLFESRIKKITDIRKRWGEGSLSKYFDESVDKLVNFKYRQTQNDYQDQDDDDDDLDPERYPEHKVRDPDGYNERQMDREYSNYMTNKYTLQFYIWSLCKDLVQYERYHLKTKVIVILAGALERCVMDTDFSSVYEQFDDAEQNFRESRDRFLKRETNRMTRNAIDIKNFKNKKQRRRSI